jgi:hypothetical protein
VYVKRKEKDLAAKRPQISVGSSLAKDVLLGIVRYVD